MSVDKKMDPLEGRVTGPDEDRPMTRSYAAVLIVQALVLLALWLAGRWFSAP